MYLFLTSVCNMTCDHCCWASGPTGMKQDKGVKFLSKPMLVKIMDWLAENYSGALYLTLGGGEPTLHPQFYDLFTYIAERLSQHTFSIGDNYLSIVTNGSQKSRALFLASVQFESFNFSAWLSQDPWHDPIDPEVVEAFSKKKTGLLTDYASPRILRAPFGNLQREGRAIENFGASAFSKSSHSIGCSCSSPTVMPNGELYLCGCLNRSYGIIPDVASPPEFYSPTMDSPIRLWRDYLHLHEDICEQRMDAEKNCEPAPVF